MTQFFAEIYTKPDCPYCVLAKEFMQGMEINYIESVVGQDVLWEDVVAVIPDAKTVPQIWINGSHVGGYDDLVKWAENN
jgi:glutaredoxin 3